MIKGGQNGPWPRFRLITNWYGIPDYVVTVFDNYFICFIYFVLFRVSKTSWSRTSPPLFFIRTGGWYNWIIKLFFFFYILSILYLPFSAVKVSFNIEKYVCESDNSFEPLFRGSSMKSTWTRVGFFKFSKLTFISIDSLVVPKKKIKPLEFNNLHVPCLPTTYIPTPNAFNYFFPPFLAVVVCGASCLSRANC